MSSNLVPMTEREASLLDRTIRRAGQLAGMRRRRVVGIAAGLVLVCSTSSAFITAAVVRDGRQATTTTRPASTGRASFRVLRPISTSQVCDYTIGPAPSGARTSVTAAQAYERVRTTVPADTTALTATVEFAGVSDPNYGPIVNGHVQPYFSDTAEWVVIFTNVPMHGFFRGPPGGHTGGAGTAAGLVDPHTGSWLNLSFC